MSQQNLIACYCYGNQFWLETEMNDLKKKANPQKLNCIFDTLIAFARE